MENVYYQPNYNEAIWDKANFESHCVYHHLHNAELDFPNLDIIEFSGDDIENPTFMDEENDLYWKQTLLLPEKQKTT